MLVLALKQHGAMGGCLDERNGPEQFAVDCVLPYLDLRVSSGNLKSRRGAIDSSTDLGSDGVSAEPTRR